MVIMPMAQRRLALASYSADELLQAAASRQRALAEVRALIERQVPPAVVPDTLAELFPIPTQQHMEVSL